MDFVHGGPNTFAQDVLRPHCDTGNAACSTLTGWHKFCIENRIHKEGKTG